MQPRVLSKVCAVAVAALGLGATDVVLAQVTSLREVERADPVRDFKAAVARGDLRFVAVDGIASGLVPGVDEHGIDRRLVAAHGKRTIRGTSDYADVKLNRLAHKYAEKYNGLLLRYLRDRPKRPNQALERTAARCAFTF